MSNLSSETKMIQYGEADERELRTANDLVHKVPAELWHMIADYLPLIDLVCLSLACKWTMGNFDYSWETFRKIDLKEKQRFLLRLDRDLPGHRICSTCVKFHQQVKMGHRDGNRCKERYVSASGIPILTWPIIQAVLRAEAYGDKRYGLSPGVLSHKWARRRFEGESWTYSTSATFRDSRLLLRVSIETIFEAKIVDIESNLMLRYQAAPFCNHMMAGGPSYSRALEFLICRCREAVREAFWALDNIQVRQWSREELDTSAYAKARIRCLFCKSIYTASASCKTPLDTTQPGNKRICLRTDRYVDLGPAEWVLQLYQFDGSRCHPAYVERHHARWKRFSLPDRRRLQYEATVAQWHPGYQSLSVNGSDVHDGCFELDACDEYFEGMLFNDLDASDGSHEQPSTYSDRWRAFKIGILNFVARILGLPPHGELKTSTVHR